MSKRKPISFVFLCIYLFCFPVLEGYSNTYFAIGSVGLGGAIAAVWVGETIITRSAYFNLAALVFFLYCLWMLATVAWSFDPGVSIGHCFRLMLVFIFYVIVCDTIRTKAEFVASISVYLSGVLVIAASGFINVYTGSSYADLSNRYSASGFDPNNFGLILASTVPLIFVVMSGKRAGYKIIGLGVLSLFVFLIISSASRAAAISLALVLLMMLVVRLESKMIIKGILAGGTVFVFFVFFFQDIIPELALDRLFIGVRDDAGGGRADIWMAALNKMEGFFLGGHGAGVTQFLLGDQAHNTFISALFEGGAIAAIGWVCFWLIHLYYGFSISWRKKVLVDRLLVVSIVPVLIAASTLNWEYRKPLFLLLGFVAVSYRLKDNSRFDDALKR